VTDLWVTSGGAEDGPVLLLLHGLGHTAEVWRGLIELLPASWQGGWVAPDLRGHGRSGWAQRYSFGEFAADVAALLPPDRHVFAVGHSMGGVVALVLAGGPGPVRAAVGFGIKVSWTDDELAAMRTRAARPPKTFDTEAEARAAFVRFGGLDGLAAPESDLVTSGVHAVSGGYRLATDPRTMLVGAPPMATLLAEAEAPVVLAAGEHDHMVTPDQLRALDERAVTLPGAGHNLHLTHPAELLTLVERAATRASGDAA
jgi:pimeloyl-ACP methyl ester carboxylesterase